jgi:hypothetical protein
MKCECGQASFLSARDYADEINKAHMDCEHCRADIHFGLAVVAIRNEQDSALDDALLPQLAWYHTSTWPDWPSAMYAERVLPELRAAANRMHLGPEHDLSRHVTAALHLGTYAAAMENMLRRMKDQSDAHMQFYLYRVQLRERLRINSGYRDENDESASHLTVPELEADGLDVVRYLNSHEARGSLSLAVQPPSILAVQRLTIPVAELVENDEDESLHATVQAIRAQQIDVEKAEAKVAHLEPRQRRMIELGGRPDPTGNVKDAAQHERRLGKLWQAMVGNLTDLYLPNVSPMVIREVHSALQCWRRGTDTSTPEDFIRRFRQVAVLFTQPERVTELLATRGSRQCHSHVPEAQRSGAP